MKGIGKACISSCHGLHFKLPCGIIIPKKQNRIPPPPPPVRGKEKYRGGAAYETQQNHPKYLLYAVGGLVRLDLRYFVLYDWNFYDSILI